MRCSKCGAQIGNSYARVNGVLLCENCARDLKLDDMFRRTSSILDQAFPSLGELPGVFSLGSDLDFANAKIRCPRCGTSLRDIETSGELGCIECYNTFNESILKNILKRQGSSEYMGRKPGAAADIKLEAQPDRTIQSDSIPAEESAKLASELKDKAAKPEAKKEDKDLLEKLKNADLGTVPDDMLEEGMKQAAAAEDYSLAVRLRDELKSRKGEN